VDTGARRFSAAYNVAGWAHVRADRRVAGRHSRPLADVAAAELERLKHVAGAAGERFERRSGKKKPANSGGGVALLLVGLGVAAGVAIYLAERASRHRGRAVA